MVLRPEQEHPTLTARDGSESAPQEVRGTPVAYVVTHGVKVSSAVDEQVIFDQPAA